MQRPIGQEFIDRHCFECGNTFDCVKNLKLHCERTLHKVSPIHREGYPFTSGSFKYD